MTWHIALKMLVGLIVIIDPLLNLPTFISLTESLTHANIQRCIRRTSLTVGIVLSISVLLGQQILDLLAISLPSFRIAGGILLMSMALSMMHARTSSTQTTEEESNEAMNKEDISVVPLGIPLLAGPGAISTVIIDAHHSFSWTLLVLGEIWLVATFVYFILQSAQPIRKALGTVGIMIATRLMGLMVAAMAIEFMVGGLKDMLPGLGH